MNKFEMWLFFGGKMPTMELPQVPMPEMNHTEYLPDPGADDEEEEVENQN